MRGRAWLSFVRVVLLTLSLIAAAAPASAFAAEAPYPTQPEGAAQTGGFFCIHTVVRGETLSSIAARFGTSVFALQRANFIFNPNLIRAGMRLRVPCVPFPRVCIQAVILVRPGDDLFRIGLRFGVRPISIALFNGLRNVNLIFAGMRLAIPCRSFAAPGMMAPYGAAGGSYSSSYGAPSGGGYSVPPPAPPPMGAPTPGMTSGGSVTVSMRNLMFSPATLTISAGQTVVWRNAEPSMIPHTATSGNCAGSACTPSPGWDSGTLNPGQSFSHKFDTPGTYHYYCRVHGAMMQGTIVVTATP